MNENCTLRTLRKRYADFHGLTLESVTGEAILMAMTQATPHAAARWMIS